MLVVYSVDIRKHLEIMAAFQTIVGVEMVEIVVTRDELIAHLAKKDVEPHPLEKQTHRTISKHGQGLYYG